MILTVLRRQALSRIVFAAGAFISGCATPHSLLDTSAPLQWEYVPSPPELGRVAHSLCLADQNRVFLYGGIRDNSSLEMMSQDLAVVDLGRRSWQVVAEEAQGPRMSYGAAFVLRGKDLLFFGGERGPGELSKETFLFDVQESRWRTIATPELLAASKRSSATLMGEKAVVFGGTTAAPSRYWGVFDFIEREWRVHELPPHVSLRAGHVAAPLSERQLMIWGGFIGPEKRDDGLMLDIETGEVRRVEATSYLSARANARAFVHDHKIYIWGGSPVDENGNSGAFFDTVKKVWAPMASPRDARFKTLKSSEFVYVEGGGGLLWGGYFDNNEFNTETYLYLPSRNSWRKLTTLGTPQGRMAHCMVAGSSRVVAVYGGIGPAADRQRLTHFDGLWLLDLNALPRDLP